MSISREQLRELAAFKDESCCAVTFYFQPSTPRNKAHKEDSILIKDLARDAMRTLESKGNSGARADIERIVRMSAEFRSNGTHGKAVFACAGRDVWREYEVPAVLGSTRIAVDRHFHLKPLAQLLGATPLLGIVLVDRHRARIFDLRLGELTEREDLHHPAPRRVRSAGLAGYDDGHAQRRVEDEVRQHFKTVGETLKEAMEKGVFERWILACQSAHMSVFESQLHPYVSQALIGNFHADLVRVSPEEIRTHALEIVDKWQAERRRELVSQALSQARSNARGVTGLRRVLRSLELGEVQTLLLGENLQGHAVECKSCGHVDAHLVSFCPVCGHATQEIVDVGEAILPWVIRRNIETFYVKDDPEFDRVGNIAALLRFRSEKVTPMTMSAMDDSRNVAEYPGRLRRLSRR
jgi:peptide subunit release factor 1 (eRF1)